MNTKHGEALSTATERERQNLEIALGVLRSNTEWADFLGSWLTDYGQRVLSCELAPLMPDDLDEPPVTDAPLYIN